MNNKDDITYDVNNLASMSDCTGLIPSGIETDEQADAYEELYGIHQNYKRDDYNELYEDDTDDIDLDYY
ncbi:MAG TPA: hypothetical protein VIL26_08020 [Clostridia bacterium]